MAMETNPLLQLKFKTEDGQPFEVPVEGSLGLLALGYIGLLAWRSKKEQVQKATQINITKKDQNGSNR